MKGYKSFNCGLNDCGRRLDRVVKKLLPEVPAGRLYSAIRKGQIRVNSKRSNQSYRIQKDDIIDVLESISTGLINTGNIRNDHSSTAELERICIQQTEDLIFLNKPAGMLTHGENSLAELLLNGLKQQDSLSFVPAPLHRLDRNTSGLIAASLSIKGASSFSELMRSRNIKKYYLGLCINGPETMVRLDNLLTRNNNITKTSLPGKGTEAGEKYKKGITTVYPLLSKGNLYLCVFNIETGITHQIRAQSASAGFPLAGDIKYGGKTAGMRGYILHSWAMVTDKSENPLFKSVFAELQPEQYAKLCSIFSKNKLSKALSEAKSRIISI